MGGEGAFGLFGNETGEERGLSFGEHFFDVSGGEFLLEDRFSEAEAFGVILGDHVGDHEGFFGFVEFGDLAVGEGELLSLIHI